MSDCKHPKECQIIDDEGDIICEWCAQVALLESDNAALHDQLEKQAIIVHGGEVTIPAQVVGYLSIRGGVVIMDIAKTACAITEYASRMTD